MWLLFDVLYLLEGKTPQLSSLVDITGEILIITMLFRPNGVRLKVSVRLRGPLPYASQIGGAA